MQQRHNPRDREPVRRALYPINITLSAETIATVEGTPSPWFTVAGATATIVWPGGSALVLLDVVSTCTAAVGSIEYRVIRTDTSAVLIPIGSPIFQIRHAAAGTYLPRTFVVVTPVPAGKYEIAVQWRRFAGVASIPTHAANGQCRLAIVPVVG